MSERVLLVVRALGGRSVAAAAREAGVSRKTAHKWLAVYQQSGCLESLRDRSRRPRRSPKQTSTAVEERVLQLREEHGWGGRKVSLLLEHEGIRISPATVDRILARRGVSGEEGRQRKATQRFERAQPNELWQMDYKAEYSLEDGRRLVPLSILDDHSRFAVGLYGLGSTGLSAAERCLRESFERYGVPQAMLMDHGTPWWSTTNGHGLTKLSVLLVEQGITLHYGGIGHPQTQGKVERFHRTLAQALRRVPRRWPELQGELARFREVYNELRPHEALGMEVPARRYQPSPRPYVARPEPWIYPPGYEVRRLNSAGVLDLPGARHFVCEALAGKEVGCQSFGSRLLITYRTLHVREIDRLTGKTWPIVRPAGQHGQSCGS